MKQLKILFGTCLTLLLLIIIPCKAQDDYPKELDQLIPGASLIFKAKIVLLHTVNTD